MGTWIFRRDDGDTPDDLVFREDLYRLVGSITVAGGHIEAALKRHLLVLTSAGEDFRLVDYSWSELEKKLRKECDSTMPRQKSLRRLIDAAQKHQLVQHRHTVVHGLWDLYAGRGVRVGRWPRGEEERIYLSDFDWLKDVNTRCWVYATRLNDLLGKDWTRAILPPTEDPPSVFRRATPPG